MDFSKFDPSAQADEGFSFSINHPFTGEPLSDENGAAMWTIRPMSSPKVKAARKALINAPKADEEEQNFALLACNVAGFQNVVMNGKPLTAADAVAFLKLSHPAFKRGKTGLIQINKTFMDQLSEAVMSVERDLGNVGGG